MQVKVKFKQEIVDKAIDYYKRNIPYIRFAYHDDFKASHNNSIFDIEYKIKNIQYPVHLIMNKNLYTTEYTDFVDGNKVINIINESGDEFPVLLEHLELYL